MSTQRNPDHDQIVKLTQTLRGWRLASGLSYVDLSFAMRGLLPPVFQASFESLRRLEIHAVDRVNPLLVVAWARACGADVTELGDDFLAQLEQIRELCTINAKPQARKRGGKTTMRGYPHAA